MLAKIGVDTAENGVPKDTYALPPIKRALDEVSRFQVVVPVVLRLLETFCNEIPNTRPTSVWLSKMLKNSPCRAESGVDTSEILFL